MIDKDEITRLWNMIYNISLQMLHNESDAEDATQDILLKIISSLESFKGESSLATWSYRIARNHLVDLALKPFVEQISFEDFEKDVKNFPAYDGELQLTQTEEKIYIEQIKTGCTMAMLQCLGPDERFIYVLGCIFATNSREGALICGIGESAYRKSLSRSRKKNRQLHE